jgi:hypothetical protein
MIETLGGGKLILFRQAVEEVAPLAFCKGRRWISHIIRLDPEFESLGLGYQISKDRASYTAPLLVESVVLCLLKLYLMSRGRHDIDINGRKKLAPAQHFRWSNYGHELRALSLHTHLVEMILVQVCCIWAGSLRYWSEGGG